MKRAFALLSLMPLLAPVVTPAFAQGKKTPPPSQQPPAKKPEPKPAEKKPAEAAHKVTGVGSELDASISLNDAAGKAHAFKDYRGKIVVIDFWSMDAASEAYTKKVAEMADEMGKKGVAFLAIDPSQADLSGSDADIVIWDPKRAYTISAKTHFMRVDYNPYEGMTMPGSAAYVFSRGKIVFEGDKFVGKAGDGQYLKRNTYNLP